MYEQEEVTMIEDVELRREISLALYSKNEKLTSKIENDLDLLAPERVFSFNLFTELKQKVQQQREKTFILICTVDDKEDIELRL